MQVQILFRASIRHVNARPRAANERQRRLGEGFVHALLRRGNCGSAEGMARFARAAIRKSRSLARWLDVRIDAGLVNGRVLDAIDDERTRFVGRIKNKAVLDGLAQPYLKRPPGRPMKQGDEFAVELGPYRAESWKMRRVAGGICSVCNRRCSRPGRGWFSTLGG